MVLGGNLFIRVSTSCATGAKVTIDPPGAAVIVAEADARDRLPVVVVISAAITQAYTVTARRDGVIVATATVTAHGVGSSPLTDVLLVTFVIVFTRAARAACRG